MSSPKNVNETIVHYNEDPEFYRSFLDPYMKYTSGLYLANESLEKACVNMLDRIIQSAYLPQNATVLEIGPGWGSLLKRLDELRPDVAFVGVSPSRVQNDFIRQNVSTKAELSTSTFESEDFGSRQFDTIFLVGSFCHLKNKLDALHKMKKLLKPNGRIIIEDSFFLSQALYEKHANHPATKFVQQDVFGFAEIPSLAAMLDTISATQLRLESTLEHSDSYRKTIAEWQRRLSQFTSFSKPAERYVAYMNVFQAGWDYTIANHLMVLKAAPSRK